MSDVLSRVQILLDADTARFEQKMNAAPATATRNFDKIKSAAKIMATVVAGAAISSAAAMISYADKQVKTINELERFSYLAQSTVPEYQKMAVGAEMFGIQQDKLADITKDFNEKLGEMATVGGGGALDFIEQVGIKTEGSANGAMKLLKTIGDLSGPEGMALYVAKMEEANLSQKQMSFLMESMASDSTMLLPLLRNNAEGMRLWGRAAEDAGIILDEKTIKSAREMQVQTKLMDMQFQGFKNQLTASLMPALVDVAGAFKNGGKEAQGMANAGQVLANILRGVASVAIGVYATVNMIANSMAGVTKTAMDSYKLADDAAKNGSWFDKLPGMKLLKAGVNFSVTANAENSGIGMAMEDNAKVIESTAESLNNMWDSKVSESIKKMAELQTQASKTTAAATQGTQDWLDKQNKVNEANQKALQAQKELERLQQQQYQDRENIKREYADRLKQIDIDLATETKRIQDAAFNAEHQTAYMEVAKARAFLERSLFIAEQEFEINQHRYTEEQKLAKEYEINKLRIQANYDLNDQLVQANLDSLSERYTREQEWLRLEQAERIFSAEQAYMHEADAMAERYRLERAEIEKTTDAVLKSRLLNASYRSEDNDYEAKRKNAWNYFQNTLAELNGTSAYFQLEQDFDYRAKDIAEALKYNLITEEEARAAALKNEEAYLQARLSLNMTTSEQIAGSYADMFRNVLGEQSAAYKTMFVAQRAFSIASSLLAIKTGIAQAASLPFPTNLGAMGTVAAATATLIDDIQSIAGIFHGGQDYVPQEASYLLKKGERVLTPDQNVDFTKFMSGMNQSSGSAANIQITNNTPAKVDARQDQNGRVYVTIDEVEQWFGAAMANPNSRPSKAVSQNTNAVRRR